MHKNFYQTHQLVTRLGSVSIQLTKALGHSLAESQRQGKQQTCALLFTDQQGSALGRLEDSTLLPISYSAYGHHPSHRHDLVAFCGQSKDATSTSYLLGQGYRAYSPKLMRFKSADTLSPFGQGGFNAYAYCLNDPVNNVDHSGHAGSRFIFKPPSSFPRLSAPDDVDVARIIAQQQRAHQITMARLGSTLALRRMRIEKLKSFGLGTPKPKQTLQPSTSSASTQTNVQQPPRPNFNDLLNRARSNTAALPSGTQPTAPANAPTFLDLLRRSKVLPDVALVRDPNATHKPN